jgi:hypothetical protein
MTANEPGSPCDQDSHDLDTHLGILSNDKLMPAR